MKNILFVSSECFPFIKTGGLADIVGSLPKYIDKTEYDVRVIIPNYSSINKGWKDKMKFLASFYMDYAGKQRYVGLLTIEKDGIKYYFIDNEEFFIGIKPYGSAYEDIVKFIFFQRAALSALPTLNFKPNIVHCHDWQASLIPIFLKGYFLNNPFYHNIKTILTIHNLKFQGIYSRKEIQYDSSLDDYYFTEDKLLMENKIDANMLKGGIVFADCVTTVSPSYAKEIMFPFYGEGLDELLRNHPTGIRGILNGLDYIEVNPKTDDRLYENYSSEDFIKGKRINKENLQNDLSLPIDQNKFVIGIVSRLTKQKGMDLINYVFENICNLKDVQVIIEGTGDEEYENALKYFNWRYQDKVHACIYYSEKLSRRIYAASDVFLMPSLFEPCGLSQLFALRYGSLPIVRETGGLKDTVSSYNQYENTGNGFTFANFNAHEMLQQIEVAHKMYFEEPDLFNQMVQRAMKSDNSWRKTILKYQDMYNELIGI